MPLPPPPAAALTSTGKSSAGVARVRDDGHDRHAGASPTSRAASLRPICSITAARRAHQLDPGVLEGLGERGALGQEAVAGVHGVGPQARAAATTASMSR